MFRKTKCWANRETNREKDTDRQTYRQSNAAGECKRARRDQRIVLLML